MRIESPQLVVPHPRLVERAFALAPMLELVPGATEPGTGIAYEVPAGDVRVTDDVL
jgi:2-amino-4-hydroxy-6-hydroxymethyldihydropteridine diphosphokinase